MDMLGICNLLVTTSVWKAILEWFVSFMGNYGWAIILFTIALKLVLFPLDLIQRRTSKKNMQMQAIVQPEIAALQKKYPNDKDKINQGTMAIYKKHNYNVVGSCVVMLVNLVVTLVVFFTLFQALNVISQEKLTSQYTQLQAVYQAADTEQAKSDAVLNEYEKIKDENGWLWVTNVWKADTNTSIMLNFDEYYKQAGLNLEEGEKEAARTEYEAIEAIIYSDESNSGWNGYFILIVLAGASTFLSQYVTSKSMKPKTQPGQQDPTASTNKVMMILMPIIMLIFAWTSTSIFALYLITNSVMTMLTGLLINKILKDKDYTASNNSGKNPPKKTKVQVMEYSRNYFKGE